MHDFVALINFPSRSNAGTGKWDRTSAEMTFWGPCRAVELFFPRALKRIRWWMIFVEYGSLTETPTHPPPVILRHTVPGVWLSCYEITWFERFGYLEKFNGCTVPWGLRYDGSHSVGDGKGQTACWKPFRPRRLRWWAAITHSERCRISLRARHFRESQPSITFSIHLVQHFFLSQIDWQVLLKIGSNVALGEQLDHSTREYD